MNSVSFKFKGANVSIQVQSDKFTPKRYRLLKELKQGVTDITAIIRKHKLGAFDNQSHIAKALSRTKFNKDIKYTITVEMGGKSEVSILNSAYSRKTVYVHIREMRHEIIRRLRANKKRYSKVNAESWSPSSIFRGTSIDDNCYYYGARNVGYVHSQSGDILKLYQRRKSKRMFEPVKPMTAERHVGIEIECGIACSREDLAMKLGHLAGYVMIKGDGSVSVPNRNSVELNVCAPISAYKSILKQVTNVLNDNHVDARVNKTCGLHVHLDIREFEGNYNRLNDMYSKLHSTQSILYSMQPKSRQSNNYCVRSKTRSIRRGLSRYQGINAQAIWKYRTIEVRLHAGTTDFIKIANWIDLLCGVMYSNTITPKRSLSSVRSMFRTFTDVPNALMEYVVERIRKFEDGNTEENETAQAI